LGDSGEEICLVYLNAVRDAFGRDIDYSMLIKLYGETVEEGSDRDVLDRFTKIGGRFLGSAIDSAVRIER
jgi:hypothetical protein